MADPPPPPRPCGKSYARMLSRWSVHGILVEVFFGGILLSGNWYLRGVSTIWSFLLYALGIFVLAECTHNRIIFLRVRFLWKCSVHVVIGLLCGVVSYLLGLLLGPPQPWDYPQFTSTMYYIFIWSLAGLYFEGIAAMEGVQPIPRWTQSGRLKIKEEEGRTTIHYANTGNRGININVT